MAADAPQARTASSAPELPALSADCRPIKVAPCLGRCLDSLLQQAPPELREIIVIDDGSPDDSGAIAGRRAAAEPRLRVIRQANAGVAAAHNAGPDAACGEYVGFVRSLRHGGSGLGAGAAAGCGRTAPRHRARGVAGGDL